MTRTEALAYSGQMQSVPFCFGGAGAPFVNTTDLVEPMDVGPTDTGGLVGYRDWHCAQEEPRPRVQQSSLFQLQITPTA